ncbi:glutamate receptor ionotropic, delta-1-like [Littorina saxatilis]|uniref:glutamate receptor ionotropic, delta-1-like n=1 Tax=Littorina saxatilis TaxID=31220 RepID=UPI0038B53749
MVSYESGQNKYSGFCVDLLDILADTLNFTYHFIRPPDGEWGDKRDGNWTGLVRLLQRKVYVCIGVTFFLATLTLLCLLRAEQFLSSDVNTRSPSTLTTIVQSIEFMFGSLVNEVVPEPVRTGPGRTFLVAWHLMALILTSFYTCKLTSLMVDVTSLPPFTSLAEMVTRDGQRWGIQGSGTKLQTTLRESPNPIEQQIYQGIMTFAQDDPDVLSFDPNVHFSKVLSENYAYVDHGPMMETLASEHCDVEVLPLMITGWEYFTFFLQKDSPLRVEINSVFLRLQDSGVLSHMRSKWFPGAEHCHGNKTLPKAITLTAVQGPFYIALGGLILASAVVLVERFAKRNGHR